MKTKQEQMDTMVGELSFFNAAEGSNYSREATARAACKVKIRETVKSWGISDEEVKAIYMNSPRGLTSWRDFI